MKLVNINNIIAITIIALLWSCSYSFTGSSVPPHLSTIAIPIVKDKSGSGEPNLSNDFTQNLTDQFFDDNTLQIVNSVNSDAILIVTILSMPERTEVVSGDNEKATAKRITINVKAVYKDLVLKKTIFDKRISNYATFDASQNYTSNRQEGIKEAIDNVVFDILLAVVSDW
ncbi:MAG: LPS assembly lipoprotein LptE [Melioribacteraceae bacterium]|nr:LPS assembly lipoprotein LptE [Melioribacteraceae bacterium]